MKKITKQPTEYGKEKTQHRCAVFFLFGMSLRGFPRCIAVLLIYKAGECSFLPEGIYLLEFISAGLFLGETIGIDITAITTIMVIKLKST